jgi:HAD superfamily hydrolase (TIGR01509 family)
VTQDRGAPPDGSETALPTVRPAAVLFDMDGTLVDSEKIWDIALDELAARYGGTLSASARRAMLGTRTAESLAILHADLGQPWRDPVAGAAWLDARVAQLFAEGVPWRPGAMALLRAVRAAGVPTALVTSTVRSLVDVALVTIGRDNFDVVVCGDEVADTKPHPEPYRAAARLLGVRVGECVAIEDSPVGVASARAAGIPVVAVPSEIALEAAEGVHLVASLDEVDMTLLATLPVDHAAALRAMSDMGDKAG